MIRNLFLFFEANKLRLKLICVFELILGKVEFGQFCAKTMLIIRHLLAVFDGRQIFPRLVQPGAEFLALGHQVRRRNDENELGAAYMTQEIFGPADLAHGVDHHQADGTQDIV